MWRKENYSEYELEKLLYKYETGDLVDKNRVVEDKDYVGIDLTNIKPLEIIILIAGVLFATKKFCPGTWISLLSFLKYLL